MDALIPPDVLARIQMEYVEMPGLKLTLEQIGRLCGLPREECASALAKLTSSGFLQKSQERERDLFTRRTSSSR